MGSLPTIGPQRPSAVSRMFERIEPISRGIFRQFATLAFHQVKKSDNGRRSLVRHVLKVLWKHGPRIGARQSGLLGGR